MTDRKITDIWFRVLQPGEFFNMERRPDLVPGGGGARYIEIPKSMTAETRRFFDVDDAMLAARGFTIQAVPIGATDGVAYPIDLKVKASKRLRIANQNRQANPNRRHPAWSHARGFPIAPNDVRTTDEAKAFLPPGGIRVFIGKLDDGSYLAGFTEGNTPPSNIAHGMELRRLWGNAGVGGVLWDIDLPVAGGEI